MAGSRDLVLGIGCDRNTPYATLAQVIDEALAQLEASWADVRAVASIDLKADEVAMQELQRQRGHTIHFYPATWLAQVPVPNPSETVRKYTGTPSVSEAAALLVVGEAAQAFAHAATDDAPARAPVPPSHAPQEASVPVSQRSVSLPVPAPMSALLIEKHKLRGPDGRNATVSVARADEMARLLPETGRHT
ncbi:cobalamin biosynthesis protein [Lautropia dentalis]|uniref:Cobalamin biosynthesis protein n=2 Tax=Lautropia dentalis TaxID=2490857 RepID=A0A426FTW7_9BURK|nr:cobalamin biosynthesis protein [Lautropia dentalis]